MDYCDGCDELAVLTETQLPHGESKRLCVMCIRESGGVVIG